MPNSPQSKSFQLGSPTDHTSQNAQGNGENHSAVFRTPLPARGAKHQVKRRGSLNVAQTVLDRRPITDLTYSLFLLVLALLENDSFTPVDLENLDPHEIARKQYQVLLAHPSIADATPDQLEERKKILRELHTSHPSKLQRELKKSFQENMDDRIAAIKALLKKQAEQSPFAAADLVSSTQQDLAAIHFPKPETEAYQKFKSVVESHLFLQQNTTDLPAQNRDRILSTLHKLAAETYDQSLQALTRNWAVEYVKNARQSLQPTLNQLHAAATELRANTDEVKRRLEQRHNDAHEQNAISKSATLLKIQGQSEPELRSALMNHLSCENEAELAPHLAEELRTRLESLATHSPLYAIQPPASLALLLRRIDPREIVITLGDLFQQSIGSGSTVYAAIRAYGVKDAVDELLRLAAPLCRLRGRDRHIYNIEVAKKAVVRLPKPQNPEDQQTHRHIRDLFDQIPRTEVLDAPANEHQITLAVTALGWNIAIDTDTETLLPYYATADKIDHTPHIFDLVPDSHNGRPIPLLVKAHRLNEERQNRA